MLIAIGGILLAGSAQAQAPVYDQVAGMSTIANYLASRRPVTYYDYQGRRCPMQRTTPKQLPKHDGDLIATLEAQLDSCRASMLTDPLAPVCPPERQQELRNAMANLVRARLHWDTTAYQQEMNFYLAEDARRQQAAAPAR